LTHPEFNPGVCDRCGLPARQRWPLSYRDGDGEHSIMVCWDCDFEILNGQGEPWDAEDEVLSRRREEFAELYPL